jgi:acyl dehydratase
VRIPGTYRFGLVRYWEDFRVGDVTELGSVEVTEEDVIAFASRFDPQPFHIDPEAARDSPFGGLIASGWHTMALFMSLYVPMLADTDSRGSPGVEAIRWLVPVRPGDTLTGRNTVSETRPSATDPRRGTVLSTNEMINQRGEVVMTFTAWGHFGRRPSSR